MIYHITIQGEMGSLNEYLSACMTHVRSAGDMKRKCEYVCVSNIRRVLKNNVLKTPIIIHYGFYAPNKKKDRMNIATWFDKVFEDALQIKNGSNNAWLKNDGWNDVYNTTHDFFVDKENPRIEIFIEEVENESVQYPLFAVSSDGVVAENVSNSFLEEVNT